ncbi:MAG TPA: hypothetical protein VJW75_02025 [Candidatus Eisenbacteria bacterium]|nr:hypothetical protein [Candidatus Eisenbacteria bacterium]
MAGRGNPSFLKNQKAQKRVAKANAKRAARMARNAEKAAGRVPGDPLGEENISALNTPEGEPEEAAEGAPDGDDTTDRNPPAA